MKDPLRAFGIALARVGHRHGLKTATRAPAFMARIEREIRGMGTQRRIKAAADDMASELQRWLEDQFGVQFGDEDGSGEHSGPQGGPGG